MMCYMSYRYKVRDYDMARRRKVHKKRTISPEQIQKMQAGRKRAQVHKDRVASVNELEERLKKARNQIR